MRIIFRAHLSLMVLLACLSPFLGIATSAAQTKRGLPASLLPYQKQIDALRNAKTEGERQAAVDDLIAVENHMRAFLEFAASSPQIEQATAKSVREKLASDLEQSRIDKQLGSAPNAAGATSAVAKASLASLLSLAVNTGAVTQSLNGTAATITGNADGIFRYAMGGEPFPYCPPGQMSCGTPILKDVGISATFDLARGSTSTLSGQNGGAAQTGNVVVPSSARQFSGASVKYVMSNPRDVRSKEFQQEWTSFYDTNRSKFQQAGQKLLSTLEPALEPLLASSAYDALEQTYRKRLLDASGSGSDVLPVFTEYLDAVLGLAESVNPKFDADVQSALAGYMLYFAATRPLLQQINEKPVFAIEYDYQRPADEPDLHQFRFLATLSPFGAQGGLDINVAGTAYGSGNTSRYGIWRDMQASAQLDRRLGDLVTYPATFSLAAYYQYMISPGLLNLGAGSVAPGTTIPLSQPATIALGPVGSIWLVQAKVTLKLKDSGAEVPISITRSNRTDLIDAPVIRGHIGLNFDFDKVFAK